MNSICLVEDEEKVSSFIKKGLGEHGYEVDIYPNGRIALIAVSQKAYNLIITGCNAAGYERY